MIVIVGSGGQLGSRFLEVLPDAIGLSRTDLDLASATRPEVLAAVLKLRPSMVVNCSAFNAVDQAETEPELCRKVNTTVVGWLAEAAAESGAAFMTFSTDFVFDGRQTAAYLETDPPNPLSVYGASKLAGEKAALAVGGEAVVARTAWLVAPGRSNFVTKVLERASQGVAFDVVNDQIGSPTFVADLTAASLAAVGEGGRGLFHLAGQGQVSRFEFARAALDEAGLDPGLVRPVPSSKYPTPAVRPANSALATIHELPVQMPGWESSLRTMIREHLSR
jgi:dTDP-4-dehydrorhamnose reductase